MHIKNKEQAIMHIENIYPPDTSAIGVSILTQVMLEYGWRSLPEEILMEVARRQVQTQQ